MRKYAVVILEIDDAKPTSEDKEYLGRILIESLRWWHEYLGRNDRLGLNNWSVYHVEWVDEVTMARILSALGRGKDYIRDRLR
jgi:hypothetical protein